MDNRDFAPLVKHISDYIAKEANNSLRASCLTFGQMRYLTFLSQEGGTAEYKTIERHFGVSQPTVAGIVARLEEKGLVETSQSPRGGKAKVCSITVEGGKKRAGLEEITKSACDRLLSGLSEEERGQLVELLSKAARGAE